MAAVAGAAAQVVAAGAVFAGAGEYLVTMTVGGQTFKQVLKVEHMSGGDDSGNPFGGIEKQP